MDVQCSGEHIQFILCCSLVFPPVIFMLSFAAISSLSNFTTHSSIILEKNQSVASVSIYAATHISFLGNINCRHFAKRPKPSQESKLVTIS
ncbi:hypothetical protein K474DRAFT_766714 [Panus rudis PR-1116 ss-1]|nr:hypothetical protein K474DRAFT_766714 [Panus rudis PR-1116 ss-1]